MILNLIVKRTGLVLSLVLFILLGCKEKIKEDSVAIVWAETKAVKFLIPRDLAGDKKIVIQLENNDQPILGEIQTVDNYIEFTPAIPFTHGLKYNVMADGKLIEKVSIPLNDRDSAPEVVGFYPSRDTVPENLLKVYIQFSQPMEEGESLRHIVLIRNNIDTIQNVFLDLEPELWDRDRMRLTLWLDPGRIKRDLQPNLKLGPPLRKGERYHLIIKDWRDFTGNPLKQDFQKDFVVGDRDDKSPDVGRWILVTPKPGSMDPLEINLNEPLDYALLNSAIEVYKMAGNKVDGLFSVKDHETKLLFTPLYPWEKGHYTLYIEGKLEDNAGNNLRRLFDRDLLKPSSDSTKPFEMKSFKVE